MRAERNPDRAMAIVSPPLGCGFQKGLRNPQPSAELLCRLARLRLGPSTQPTFLSSDAVLIIAPPKARQQPCARERRTYNPHSSVVSIQILEEFSMAPRAAFFCSLLAF